MSWTKGYKAFNRVNTSKNTGECMEFIFEEGETYTTKGELSLCNNGFHACKDLVFTGSYYKLNTRETIYAEVEFLGECIYEQPTKHKGVTNKIRIVRFLSDEESNKIIKSSMNRNSGIYNSGNYNSGHCNSGDRNPGSNNSGDRNPGSNNSGDRNPGNNNSGNYNSGDRNPGSNNTGDSNPGDSNSGHYNPGDSNSGHYNPGNCNSGNDNPGDSNSGNDNSGNYNSGDRNPGDSNSGRYNPGDYNSGSYNTCDRETGFFNSKQSDTIRVFNKDCSRAEWDKAVKPGFLHTINVENTSYKKAFQKAYEVASKEEIELLKALPNFDASIFFEITGIWVDKEKE